VTVLKLVALVFFYVGLQAVAWAIAGPWVAFGVFVVLSLAGVANVDRLSDWTSGRPQ
jgi:hypothetical protein